MSDKKMDFSCQGVQEGGVALLDKDGSAVGVIFKEEDARRVVACLNACKGISTENLEDNKPIIELANDYNAVLKQRDDLLTELKRMVDVFGRDGHDTEYEEGECIDIDIARAVIAKAEGNAE